MGGEGKKREKRGRTCLSSYPEFKMIGGSNKLKNRVCLNDYHQLPSPISTSSQLASWQAGLVYIETSTSLLASSQPEHDLRASP
jgi:hypothetical protein